MLRLSKLQDLFRISIRRIFRSRRRYFGPASAILLGTAGLIVVMTMRGDIKEKANKDLDLLGGATILEVYYEDRPLQEPWAAKQRFFLWDAIWAVERVPGVSIVSAVAFKSEPASVVWGERQSRVPLVAVDHYFWNLQSFTPLDGTFFGKDAIDNGDRICVVGAELARRIFDTETVAGNHLLIDDQLYRIAGVLDGFRVGPGTRFVFVPMTAALSRTSHMTLPARLLVRCDGWDKVSSVAAAIPQALGEYVYTDGLRVDGFWGNLHRVKKVAFWLELFANVSAVATLVLGGIGIWNIQMAAVRTRTREIGIKKAVGAEDRDIWIQFLSESLFLCLGSALLGIVLGAVSLEGISFLLKSRPPLDLFLGSVGLSLVFALVVGVAAGLYPALKAGKMEVAAALRYE